MVYVIVYNRPWCRNLAGQLEAKTSNTFIAIDNKKDLNWDHLDSINPDYIFFPHWSFIIPKEIYKNFNCVIFHMTDLPYGRGGSPLQNLIVRGHNDTMISAIQCVKEIDAGPVYLKKSLSLYGTAEEIFIRANHIIEKMIVEIIETNPQPLQQRGEITKFRRRKPEDGDLSRSKSIDEVFDYIRMLDADGYQPAFIRVGNYKIEFFRATKKIDAVHASVKVTWESESE